MTANGTCQMIACCGRHHFSHTWLDRGGAEEDLTELNGWSSPQMLRPTAPAPATPAPTAHTTACIMTDRP
jgi:hypothetical protein